MSVGAWCLPGRRNVPASLRRPFVVIDRLRQERRSLSCRYCRIRKSCCLAVVQIQLTLWLPLQKLRNRPLLEMGEQSLQGPPAPRRRPPDSDGEDNSAAPGSPGAAPPPADTPRPPDLDDDGNSAAPGNPGAAPPPADTPRPIRAMMMTSGPRRAMRRARHLHSRRPIQHPCHPMTMRKTRMTWAEKTMMKIENC